MTEEIKKRFVKLRLQLEPEVLYEDGELNHEEAKEKSNKIWEEWIEVEKILGREVTEEEVEQLIFDRINNRESLN